MLQGLFRRVESDNAAGIDDHALGLTALPIAAPPLEVEVLRVKLVEVDLPPAIGVPVPGHGFRRGLSNPRGTGKTPEANRERNNCCHFEKIAARFQLVALL